MNMNQEKIKDKKIQFYLPVSAQVNNNTIWHREYPYSKGVYDSGGLWAYVRDKSQYEKTQANMSIEKSILECRLNYTKRIGSLYKAIYRGNVYDVSLPDNYEGYAEETKFILTMSVDHNDYKGADVYV